MASKEKTEAAEAATATAPEQPEVEDKETKTKSVVPTKYRKKYGTAATCGDQLAAAMAKAKADGLSPEAIGAQNHVDVTKRWGERNLGMRRMNLGNVLRGKVRNGEAVTIGEVVIPGLPQDED